MSAHPDFQKYLPMRLPTWRYDRASRLAEHQPRALRPSRRWDDEITKRYYRFLLKWHHASDEERFTLFHEDPPVFYAHTWYYLPDREYRTILEARILSGMNNEEIAAKMASEPNTIEVYEQLFFDVRSRLSADDYILKVVLGNNGEQRQTDSEGRMTNESREMVYKLFAWKGGPQVLDVMLGGLADRDIPRTPDEISQWLDDSIESLIKRKAAIAARTFQVNKYNVMTLLGLSVQMIESKRQVTAQSGPKSQFEQNVAQVLKEVSWSSGDEGGADWNHKQLTFANTAVEPRASEMADLASGNTPKSLQEDAEVTLRLSGNGGRENDKQGS